MTLILQGTDNSVSSPAVQGGTAGTTTGVYYPATNQVALATNGTQAVLIDSAQKVGIGTSPSYVLDILNANAIMRLNSNSNSNGAQVVLGTGVGTLTSTQTIYYDGAFAIAKAYSGTTLNIDSSGRVTMPNNPAFMAGNSSGSQTITNNSYNTVTCNTTRYNIGSNYNTSTSTFTAPVAGLYAFKLYATILTATSNAITGGNDFQLKLYVNGSDYGVSGSNGDYGGNPVGYFASSTRLSYAYLNANDTATMTIYQNAGSSQTLQLAMCNFSGYLVR